MGRCCPVCLESLERPLWRASRRQGCLRYLREKGKDVQKQKRRVSPKPEVWGSERRQQEELRSKQADLAKSQERSEVLAAPAVDCWKREELPGHPFAGEVERKKMPGREKK